MNAALEQLRHQFEQALVAAFGSDYAEVDPILVSASNPKFGDYQANVALALTKQLGQSPRAIAEQLVKQLDVANICEQPTVAGPGFINLTLKPAYLETQLSAIQSDARLGVATAKQPKKVVVDFSSPNIAKEMHVGHLRSTIIGDCIARVLEFRGHQVLRLNHVGDWGTQFGMLITHLREAELKNPIDSLDIGDLVEFYREAKKIFDDDGEFRERSRKAVVALQSGNDEAKIYWSFLCNESRREFQVIYDLLNVRLTERGESFYNPYLSEVVEDLDKAGLLVEDQGAKCVFLEGFTNRVGEPLPLIVQKSDGGYNYATTDLAAIRYRIQQDHAKQIIYVTDAGQANHFAQVFQVARKAGWVPDDVELVHVPFGLVLGEDGKKFKTRSGETVRLKDLLDEAIFRARADLKTRLKEEGRTETEEFISHVAQTVGIDAVKYADLSQNRTSNYIFSYDKMLALKGNTAPYMLYAYVRTQGISREGNIEMRDLQGDILPVNSLPTGYFRADNLSEKTQLETRDLQEDSLSVNSFEQQLGANAKILLREETELVLAKHLLRLDEVISDVEQELLPNHLCEYLYQLSDKFNKFYENCPVLKSEEPIRTSRLLLCDLTARTLKLGLSLLGISVVERM